MKSPSPSGMTWSPGPRLLFLLLAQASSSVDRDTRLRVALPVTLAARLWQLLGDNLTDQERST